MKTLRSVIGIAIGVVLIPCRVPFYMRCFAMGVRCGRLGIEISDQDVVELCR